MNVEEFASQYPRPPEITRAQQPHYTNVRFTKEEYEAASRVIDNPKTQAMFSGTFQGMIRWAFYYTISTLERMVNDKHFQPLAVQLEEELAAYNSEVRLDQIKEFMVKRGRQLAALESLPEEALKLHARTLEFCYRQPHPINTVLANAWWEHPELEKFRASMLKNDPEALREVESKWT